MKLLAIIAVLMMVISCNDDSTHQEEEQTETGFFSPDVLKEGNKWVYWHYEIDDFFEAPDEIIYTGEIDSVEVMGYGEYNGISYSIVKTRKFNSDGLLFEETFSNQRITPSTHWVYFSSQNSYPENEEDGFVKHPGEDWDYFWIETEYALEYGEVEYRLREPTTVNIDGVMYDVLPYNGVFTPNENYPDMVSKTIEYNYNKDVGLVNFVCHSVHGTYAFGTRLKSFTPGN